MSQMELFYDDLSDKKVLIGISGGINSAGLLCYLASEYPVEFRPKNVFLYYAHFIEHSPGTGKFAIDCIRYAIEKFECVRWKVSINSVLKFFEGEKFIPHPMLSPCSEHLKYIPTKKYTDDNGVDYDLIGFVRSEKMRINRQIKNGVTGKKYPIAHLSDNDCLALVDKEIGYHPKIYDILRNNKRVFAHNNCLPCKNMNTVNLNDVQKYYPEYWERANDLAIKLGSYWGRDEGEGACGYCNFS